MNINLTLIVQMIVFIALIWATMKFVWPKIIDAMEERSRKIAAGLAAAEKMAARSQCIPGRAVAPTEVRTETVLARGFP